MIGFTPLNPAIDSAFMITDKRVLSGLMTTGSFTSILFVTDLMPLIALTAVSAAALAVCESTVPLKVTTLSFTVPLTGDCIADNTVSTCF